jgi:AcrR family transcriptional regulator
MKSRKSSNVRMGAENSSVRAELIEAAEEILRSEGCGAITAGRLAETLGLKRQIVHYYFGTIEDLLIAMLRRNSERFRARLQEELQSGDPLRAIWEFGNKGTTTIAEFTALALRQPALRNELRYHMEEFRRIEVAAIKQYLALRGMESKVSAEAISLGLNSIAHAMVVGRALGISTGHTEMKQAIEAWIRTFADSKTAISMKRRARSA